MRIEINTNGFWLYGYDSGKKRWISYTTSAGKSRWLLWSQRPDQRLEKHNSFVPSFMKWKLKWPFKGQLYYYCD